MLIDHGLGNGANGRRAPFDDRLVRVESHDGVANRRTRVARASPASAFRRSMTADGLRPSSGDLPG